MTAEILTLIQAVGAPTAIAIIIILRIESRLDALAVALLNLPADIARRACAAGPEDCPFKAARN